MPTLSPSEMDALLRGPVVARLATIKPDGSPYVVPIWQHWDGEAMFLVARERSRFVEHVRHDARVAVSCADDASGDNRRVLLEGRCEIVEGPALMSGRMLAIAREMANRYRGAQGLDYLTGTQDRARFLLRIRPERISTWKGGEWHPRYR